MTVQVAANQVADELCVCVVSEQKRFCTNFRRVLVHRRRRTGVEPLKLVIFQFIYGVISQMSWDIWKLLSSPLVILYDLSYCCHNYVLTLSCFQCFKVDGRGDKFIVWLSAGSLWWLWVWDDVGWHHGVQSVHSRHASITVYSIKLDNNFIVLRQLQLQLQLLIDLVKFF